MTAFRHRPKSGSIPFISQGNAGATFSGHEHGWQFELQDIKGISARIGQYIEESIMRADPLLHRHVGNEGQVTVTKTELMGHEMLIPQ